MSAELGVRAPGQETERNVVLLRNRYEEQDKTIQRIMRFLATLFSREHFPIGSKRARLAIREPEVCHVKVGELGGCVSCVRWHALSRLFTPRHAHTLPLTNTDALSPVHSMRV